ncbi:hypothetical protein LDENG_00116010, partial [Lucifuga dentata]
PYLSELLHPYTPSSSLRSSSAVLLSIPTFRLCTMGARAFGCSAPRLWNSLALHIRKLESFTYFKLQIKTHLFQTSLHSVSQLFYILSMSCTVLIVLNICGFVVL